MSIRPIFDHLCKGDSDAADLCELVFDTWNRIDHLADDQVPREQHLNELTRAMWQCTVSMSANPFFRQHQEALMVSYGNALTSWKTSTVLQRHPKQHFHVVAHVLRWVPLEFFLHVARIVGGEKWADQCAVPFWIVMTQDHPLEEFLAECGPKE